MLMQKMLQMLKIFLTSLNRPIFYTRFHLLNCQLTGLKIL